MSSLNQVTIIGHLGKNPEVLVAEPDSFVRISIATHRQYKTKEGSLRQDTDWHTVYLNGSAGKWAGVTLKKEDNVFVFGDLRSSSWQDKKGQLHYSTAIYAKEIKLLGVKPQKNTCPTEPSDEVSAYEKAKQQMDQTLGRLPGKK